MSPDRMCRTRDGREKAVYTSFDEAMEAIAKMRDPVHAYRCDEHNGWHIGHNSRIAVA